MVIQVGFLQGSPTLSWILPSIFNFKDCRSMDQSSAEHWQGQEPQAGGIGLAIRLAVGFSY